MHRKILFTLAALAFMATTPAAADGYRDMVKQLIATSSGGFGTVITQLKTMQADEQVKGKGETTWLLDSDFERYLDSQYADDMTDLYLPCYRDNMTEGQLRELIEYNSRPEVKAAANHVASMTQQVTTDVALMAVSWIKAYKDGNDMVARRLMLRAAFLAGSAFTKSYVGYVHAVAHSLGGKYNTPHGLANAVLLPYVLDYYGKSAWKKLAILAEAVGISGRSDEDKAKAFIGEIRRIEGNLRIPARLPEVREEDIDELSAYADKEANPLYPVPRLMGKEELRVFYRMVMAKEKNHTATA